MAPGDLIFLNTRAVHELRFQQKDTLLINFCLKQEIFQQTLAEFYKDRNLISDFFREENSGKNYIFFSLGHRVQAQSMLTSLIQEYAGNNFHQSFQLEATLLLLFTYLVREKELSYYGSDEYTYHILQYLHEHGPDTDTETAAGHFGISAAQMDEHLKKHTGRDFMSYVWDLRLDRALKLLSNPDLNIYQVAESCGFQNVDEFSGLFQKKFHVTPTEYRKQFL